jgi:hypothetical protein
MRKDSRRGRNEKMKASTSFGIIMMIVSLILNSLSVVSRVHEVGSSRDKLNSYRKNKKLERYDTRIGKNAQQVMMGSWRE